MKIITPYTEIITPLDGDAILRHIELCGRVCYKSEDRITEDSARKFVANLIKRRHESVLEHYSFTVRFICDRGVSHELVRHRLCSVSQESTRYVSYGDEKSGCTFILPCFFVLNDYDDRPDYYELWESEMKNADFKYRLLLNCGLSPQEARSVLPNSLKTEVIMTANLREWRHILKLRTAKGVHPQMRELTVPLLEELKGKIPVVFDDILMSFYA